METISFKDRVIKVNPTLLLQEEYLNMHTPIKTICVKCGFGKTFDWHPSPQALLKEKACPICSGRQLNYLAPGVNDLETWCNVNDRNDILDDWDYDENKKDPKTPNIPSEISRSNSKVKVHWRCAICRHRWTQTTNKRTTIDARTKTTSQCPHCSKAGTSFSEQAILFYLNKVYSDYQYRESNAIGKELDFYIPSINIAIEFDGLIYHKDKLEKDNEKDDLCNAKGIKLYRLRDSHLPNTKSAIIITCYGIQHFKDFDLALKQLFTSINPDYVPNIDIKRDYGEIIKGYKQRTLNNNLATLYPEIAKEWHPTKNGDLKPENFTAGEAFPAYWICSVCGHVWPAVIYSRTTGKHNCPKCALKKQGQSYRKSRASKNNLYDWCIANGRENLLDEWDYDANILDESCPNTPEECPAGSPRDVHWVCSTCGHKWLAGPAYRRSGGMGCEVCCNTKLVLGKNDLKTWCNENNRQDLLEEWDYEENRKDIECPNSPEEVKYNAFTPVHWICSNPNCANTWKVELYRRTVDNRGCKLCSIRKHGNRKRKVLNIETGEIYDSILKAELALGGQKNTRLISACCNNKRETAYGFHWRFYEDNNQD